MALSKKDLENSAMYLDSILEKQILFNGKNVDIIEGIATSFNMHKISYSYNQLNNHVSMSYFDNTTKKAIPLVEKRINSVTDFEDALIKADTNLYNYFLKN